MTASRWFLWIVLALAAGLSANAQEPAPAARGSDASPASAPDEQADDEVDEARQELLRRQAQPRPIDAAPEGPVRAAPARSGPSESVRSTSGTAPKAFGAARPQRQEGDLIVYRRGRMLRTEQGPSQWVFAFDAEGSGLEESAVLLMPCQTLQSMEQTLGESGPDVSFVVSGEVFIYRGEEYFLPRVARIWQPRGNLQP